MRVDYQLPLGYREDPEDQREVLNSFLQRIY